MKIAAQGGLVVKKSVLLILCFLTVLIGCSDNEKQKDTEKDGESNMENVTGFWSGAIEIPNQPLKINVEFEDDKGMISIPIQGLENYPLSTIKREGKSITFTMEVQGQRIIFDGDVDGEEIAGTFKQNGQFFPFTLTRGEKTAENKEEDGEFIQTETELGTLYGELEMPKGEGPFPVMVIIPGSGPTDRNGNTAAGKNNSLKLLAEALADKGIASLRYDKRGAGKNSSVSVPEEELNFDQFIADATAWIELLKQDKQYTDIGIIGHSQGSLVGMLAAQKGDADIFISLAGAGRTIDQVMYDQLKEQLPDDLLKESKKIMDQIKAGKTVEDIGKELQSLFRPSVQPFLSSWMKYDPAEEIKNLDIPTLIINGKNDIQVPVSEAEILHDAKTDAGILLIEKMNHVLKEAPEDRAGNIATYSDPDLPLATGLMDGIMEFLKENNFVE